MIIKKIIIIFLAFLPVYTFLVYTGPPFICDDPETTAYKKGEFYLGSYGISKKNYFFALAPFIELDYGLTPNVQLHAITPLALNKTKGLGMHYGSGDIELGIKYRFNNESTFFPEIATFPLVEVPVGDAGDQLGNGKTQIFIPIWLQKSLGTWKIFGGGGYWINPGENNKNWWYAGIVIEKQVNKNFYLGVETVYATKVRYTLKAQKDESAFWILDVGGGVQIAKHSQIIFGLGKDIKSNLLLYYISYFRRWSI